MAPKLKGEAPTGSPGPFLFEWGGPEAIMPLSDFIRLHEALEGLIRPYEAICDLTRLYKACIRPVQGLIRLL